MLFFKTVDSRDAVNKATWVYPRRVLKDSMEAACGLFIAIYLLLNRKEQIVVCSILWLIIAISVKFL